MKERVDKIKNQAKIVREVIKNPLATDREVAKATWVWKSTANRARKELGQVGTKIEAIQEIIKNDMEIVKLWQSIIMQRMETQPDKLSTKDIISATDTWAKRYSLFKWDVTDPEWWLKDISITWN